MSKASPFWTGFVLCLALSTSARPAERHWAYVPPVSPELPAVRDASWCLNPIDVFVLARLEAEGMRPSPGAPRAILVRRLYLDLLGLPPPVEVVDAFVRDDSPSAYEDLVDRLLASPHHGERQARRWLDLARYADSNGYQRDGHRTVWPYRDWVIGAMNADLPFDRFTVQQIAGDLLPAASLDQKVATGFHRSTTVNVEAGVDQEEDRVLAVFDRVDTTATVWLGTTLRCARCHEHKYDPFSQEDYYALFAFFNNTPLETTAGAGSKREFSGPRLAVPRDPEERGERAALEKERAGLAERVARHSGERASGQQAWEAGLQGDAEALRALPKSLRALVETPGEKRTKPQLEKLREGFLDLDPVLKAERAELRELDRRIRQLAPPTTLVMEEIDTPRRTRVFRRGNFLDPGQEVEARTPPALHPFPEGAPRNRLGLARWLVSPRNPLIARVTVNRWWDQFFGRGIVRSLEDFGSQGDPPTHPRLLDWLACELVRSGWSRKTILRLIVTSRTYRQDSHVSREALERDPGNRLLARASRLRLDAETVRDNALAISGLLCEKMGGPPVYPVQPANVWRVTGVVDNTYRTSTGEDRYRRGVYVVWRRSSPYPSFVNFDAPDRASCTVKRSRTNSPLQALTLLNDPVHVEMARELALRVEARTAGAPAREKLLGAFRIALARPPSEAELDVLEQAYRDELERLTSQPDRVEGVLAGWPDPARRDLRDSARIELAATLRVARVLLNLDETITRN